MTHLAIRFATSCVLRMRIRLDAPSEGLADLSLNCLLGLSGGGASVTGVRVAESWKTAGERAEGI